MLSPFVTTYVDVNGSTADETEAVFGPVLVTAGAEKAGGGITGGGGDDIASPPVVVVERHPCRHISDPTAIT
jgi:hypothetical protein